MLALPNLERNQPMLAVATLPTESEASHSAAPRVTLADRWQLVLAVPIFSLVGIGLLQFAWLLAAEHALHLATDGGAREALLPKATFRSVAYTIEHELAGRPWSERLDPPQITVGGRSTVAAIAPRCGDEVVVRVSVDATAIAPDLLRHVGVSLAGLKLTAQSKVITP